MVVACVAGIKGEGGGGVRERIREENDGEDWGLLLLTLSPATQARLVEPKAFPTML